MIINNEADYQILDDGSEVSRLEYISHYVRCIPDWVSPLIYDETSILDGEVGLVYFFIYEAKELIDSIIIYKETHPYELILECFFMDINNLKGILQKDIPPFICLTNYVEIESKEGKRICENFIDDPRYSLTAEDRDYLSEHHSMILKIINESSVPLSIDFNRIKSLLVEMYERKKDVLI